MICEANGIEYRLATTNFTRRFKMLCGLTPYEYICKICTSESERFIPGPIHPMPGLNTCPAPRISGAARGAGGR